MSDRFTEINDATGFAKGDEFENEEQVRAYFTRSNLVWMFDLPDADLPTQEELDAMAEAVIEHRWHMRGVD